MSTENILKLTIGITSITVFLSLVTIGVIIYKALI